MNNTKTKQVDVLGAVAILIGTCIGAGILGLPYVISKVGLVIGLLYLVVFGAIILITSLAYGEVVLRTKGVHQFTEYAHIYLGPTGKKIAFISPIIGYLGAMIAYLTEVSNFLHALISPYLGGDLIVYRLAYFIFLAAAIYFGLGMVKKLEKAMVFGIILIVVLLVIFGLPKIEINNLIDFDLNYMLLPYGVVLFSLGGAGAIPDMKNILANNKRKLKKAIIIGATIPIFVYIIFSFMIVGISGKDTSESAILGLQNYLGSGAVTIGAIFGILTMTTSFLALGIVAKEIYQFDFKIKKNLAWALVVFPPLIFVLLNLLSFIEVIGIAGALVSGLAGIIIMAMFQKAKKTGKRKPEYTLRLPNYLRYIIYLVFAGGIVYEFYFVLSKFL